MLKRYLSVPLLILMLAGCGPTEPADSTGSASVPVEGDPVGDETFTEESISDSPATALTAELEGLSLAEFFEVSNNTLLLRSPELIVELGLSDTFGIDPILNNVSYYYAQETTQMVEVVLDALYSYDYDSLSFDEQVSYDIYEWWLEDSLAQSEYFLYDYPVTFFITGLHVQTEVFFTDLHPIRNKQDAEDYVARLWLIDEKFTQIGERLEMSRDAGILPPKFVFQWTRGGINGMAGSSPSSTSYYETFDDRLDELDLTPEERGELLRGAEDAIVESILPAYRELRDLIDDIIDDAPSDDGVWQFSGGQGYYEMLLRHHTTTDMTPDEIHQLGLDELDRINAEMLLLFDELGYDTENLSLEELFAQVARDGGEIDEDEVLDYYAEIIVDADSRLDAAFDIRPDAPVVVEEIPNDGTGAYYIGPSIDGTRPGTFYAGVSGSEPLYGMRSLAYHEAVPGHHYQISIAQELEDLPSFRTGIVFTAYAEGWALYTEYLAYELGWYDDDPYGDLGRLQYEAFRAARLVVDTGLHYKAWTFDQAAMFFVENTGYGFQMARGQMARYIVWPGQATSYKIGMIEILRQRQRAEDALGEDFDLREFHNVILTSGSVPLEVLEKIVDHYIEEVENR